MSTKAEQAWAVLNERQRLYLSVIYDADQAAEDDITSRSARWEKTPPAAQWRQITYDIKDTLRRRGEHDPGSGSTPEDVYAIPAGLLWWQIRDLTRTEKSIHRLQQHPGGPLVEVIDAPNGPFHRGTTVPLIVLTESGREHYARHLHEYREHYPELDIPTTASQESRTRRGTS